MSFNIPDAPSRRVVVVGGGFGGLKLCTTLAKNPDYQVVLIDVNNFHQFPPLIYQIATSGLQVSSIAFPFRKMFAGLKNVYFRMCELRAVFPKERYIQTSIGKLDYDMLVIATGTTTNYFGNTKIQEESMPMKTINESLGLRNALLNTFERANTCSSEQERAELLNVIIVGGGPTGVEVAGALAEMRQHVLPRDYPDLDTSLFKIHLIQGGKRLLPAMSEKASAASLKYLLDMGVDVQLNAKVTDYQDHEVLLRDGRSFRSQSIIWVCGVTGRRIKGIDDDKYGPGNRLIVDRFNKVEGYSNIYAIGDIALMRTHVYPGGHPQMAQAAIQQGRNLALNFGRADRGESLVPFEYKNLGSMATIGRNKAVADIFGMKLTGFIAWFLWMGVHLMSILGVRNKIATVLDWAWSYFTYDKSNRTIIAVKHPKVILQRNYDMSMRHWGERSEEIAMDAERLYGHPTDDPKKHASTATTADEDAESAAEELARNALAKAAARLDAINQQSCQQAAQDAKTECNSAALSTESKSTDCGCNAAAPIPPSADCGCNAATQSTAADCGCNAAKAVDAAAAKAQADAEARASNKAREANAAHQSTVAKANADAAAKAKEAAAQKAEASVPAQASAAAQVAATAPSKGAASAAQAAEQEVEVKAESIAQTNTVRADVSTETHMAGNVEIKVSRAKRK